MTLLWVVEGAPFDSAKLREMIDERVDLVETPRADAPVAIAKARARGAVVAVGPCERLASLLELGADEVTTWASAPAVIHDVIGRARARAQWRASNRDAESTDLAGLAFMSAAIGHELRNPLAAAMINCTTLATLVGPLDTQSELHGTLSDLNEALRSIAHVVSQMVALTDPGEPGTCDLSRTLVELTTYLQKEVELTADFEADVPSAPCPVALSRTRAVEVVASLLNNAVFAIEGISGRRGRIGLRLSSEDDMVVVDVADNGVGMTTDVRRQALQPFFTTRRPGALGMGLTFAAMHVRRAGGELLIDSEPGEGTSVRVFLPKIPEPAESATRVKN